MSAWLTENAHIDVLVNALAAYDLLDGRRPQDVGQILWTENNRSVNYRYGERRRHPVYVLHTTEASLHPVAVLKAISCFDYQSCERPDWERSRAYLLIERLRAAILAAHPKLAEQVPSPYTSGKTWEAFHEHPVYDTAPWGFDSLEQAYAVNY